MFIIIDKIVTTTIVFICGFINIFDSKKEKIECDYRGYIEYLKAESAGTVDMYTPSGNSPSAVGFCLAMMY